ncbi:MAG: right-handed parallel beta-helix repeat-containing protein [Sphingopyxis sp.]|nr:right-handed parallel beta-helix repeat-containing protein [Sphingopyxis sp.]
MYKVKDYGAIGDGFADDTAAIQALLNQFGSISSSINSDPIHIDFEDNVYRITQPIVVKQNYLRLTGHGATLRCDGAAYGIFLSYDNSVNILTGVEIENLVVDGATIHGILIQGAAQARIKRMKICNSGSDGIAVFGSYALKIEDCECDDNGDYAYREQAFVKTYGQSSTLVHCIGNEVVRLRAYRNGYGGMAFYESWHPYVVRPDMEDNGGTSGRGISFETVLNGVIDTPYDEKSRYAVVIDKVERLMGSGHACGQNIVRSAQIGGEAVGGVTPYSVFIIGSDQNVIENGRFGGEVVINSTSSDNIVLPGTFILQGFTDNGANTRDLR